MWSEDDALRMRSSLHTPLLPVAHAPPELDAHEDTSRGVRVNAKDRLQALQLKGGVLAPRFASEAVERRFLADFFRSYALLHTVGFALYFSGDAMLLWSQPADCATYRYFNLPINLCVVVLAMDAQLLISRVYAHFMRNRETARVVGVGSWLAYTTFWVLWNGALAVVGLAADPDSMSTNGGGDGDDGGGGGGGDGGDGGESAGEPPQPSICDPTSTGLMLLLFVIIGVIGGSQGLRFHHKLLMVLYAFVLECSSWRADLYQNRMGGVASFVGILAMHVHELARRRGFAESERVVILSDLRLHDQAEVVSYLFHELRNDQNATSGTIDLLIHELEAGKAKVAPEVEELLHDTRVHSRHAVQVIANMLDYTKLLADKLLLPSLPFELSDVLRESLVLVRHLVRDRPVRLLCESTATAVPPLVGSALHLKQVLVNLLTNACKYTDNGTIELCAERLHLRGGAVASTSSASAVATTVAATAITDAATATATGAEPGREEHRGEAEARNGSEVVIAFAVKDTGRGVRSKLRAKMFEPYEQGLEPGTGLGLQLCHCLVRKMGGDLVYSDRPEGGSIFSFTVSFALADGEARRKGASPQGAARGGYPNSAPEVSRNTSGEASVPSPLPPPLPPLPPPLPSLPPPLPSLPPLRVLIADDMKVNRVLLDKELRDVLGARLTVVHAASGEEAWALLQAQAFDAVILDEHYSHNQDALKGSSVTRLLRARESQLHLKPEQSTLVVGWSANYDHEDENCLRYVRSAGQDTAWGKPAPSCSGQVLLELLQQKRAGSADPAHAGRTPQFG